MNHVLKSYNANQANVVEAIRETKSNCQFKFDVKDFITKKCSRNKKCTKRGTFKIFL